MGTQPYGFYSGTPQTELNRMVAIMETVAREVMSEEDSTPVPVA